VGRVTTTVVNNAQRHRYEAVVDGRVVGYSAYHMRADAIVFTHTEVDESMEGHGIGSDIARSALDDQHAKGTRVVVQCPFIKAYIERHPGYADLLAERG
jgi:predicted GNAT family acetyltransferase